MQQSSAISRKQFGSPLLFDPSEGETIIEPLGTGDGYWAGAPSVIYDQETERFYLYYRLRKPRPVRGGLCRIDQSSDGVHFETIWEATKEDFDSPSIERDRKSVV